MPGGIMSVWSFPNHWRVSSIYHGNEDLYHAKECKHHEERLSVVARRPITGIVALVILHVSSRSLFMLPRLITPITFSYIFSLSLSLNVVIFADFDFGFARHALATITLLTSTKEQLFEIHFGDSADAKKLDKTREGRACAFWFQSKSRTELQSVHQTVAAPCTG